MCAVSAGQIVAVEQLDKQAGRSLLPVIGGHQMRIIGMVCRPLCAPFAASHCHNHTLLAGWRAVLAILDLHHTILPPRHTPLSPAAVRMRSAVAQCHGSSGRSLAGAPRASKARTRRSLRVYAVNHDPENLFKGLPVAEGIIERRMMSKQMQTDKQFAAMVTAAQSDDRKKLLLRRQSRTPPTDHIELVEFFLNTEADDMEVRVRGPDVLCELSVGQAACLAGLLRASDPTAAPEQQKQLPHIFLHTPLIAGCSQT